MKWLRDHDPGLLALRRAGRTALVMPGLFFFTDKVIGNPLVATFAAFGSFALLALVDFGGSMRERLESEAALAVAGALLVCLATLVSQSTVLAVVTMVLVGFGVLFAGVVSSVLAGATTSLLLAFILPVSLPGPVSSIPDRLAGWGLASGAALVAITVLWPAPVRNPLRDAAITACRELAARLRADVAAVLEPSSDALAAQRAAAESAANAVAALGQVFLAMPYRPTGLSTAARTLVRLVDEIRWLNAIMLEAGAPAAHGTIDQRVCDVKRAAAQVLERGADLLDEPRRDPAALRDARAALTAAVAALEEGATLRLPSGGDDPATADVVSALDPAFRAQELSFVISEIGTNIDFAAAADRRSWLDRFLGRQPEGLATTLAAAQERAESFVDRDAVWLQNSVRGAIGLGLAVLVSRVASVDHAFWVVLGTLSVLRSNALNTGQTVVRAVAGTLVGFVVGAIIVSIVGTDTTVLWFLLPFAVLLAGLAPAAIGFAAGQAAFTLTLLILFNILQPEGWRIGLVRIEDVALGCAVSLVVGLLFWPRGATAALSRALAAAYVASAKYLAGAVEFAVACCDGSAGAPMSPEGSALAAAASRRLDDAFRAFLAERGAKPVPLGQVTSLVTGVVGLRLAGDAVLDLWRRDGTVDGDRTAATRELLASARQMTAWYDRFAASLVGDARLPDASAADPLANGRLVDAVSHDLRSQDGRATATGVRVIWTSDQLDAARRLQALLVDPARDVVDQPDQRSDGERVRSPA
jgi:uncharacterized membrane protein YccC